MKKLKRLPLVLLILMLATVNISPVWANNDSSQGYERKILIMDSKLNNVQIDDILKRHGALKIKELPLVEGIAVQVSKNSLEGLIKDSQISRVEEDSRINISTKKTANQPSISQQPSQTIPWGISKIQADKTFDLAAANKIKVGVIDSGIELNHPDLVDNIKGGFNTIKHGDSYNDDYGHGTHVAGIIAANNNTIGVVGVAPQVELYAIKILDSNGNGYLSDLIEGIDWSIKKKLQVINMSFSLVDSQTLHDAIIKAYQAGIVEIAAAGNSYSNPVGYPAAYPEVISVSSTDENDQLSIFSSTGKVDIAAPGSNIYSTYKGSFYATESGTSMSAPHITGAVAVLLSVPNKVDINRDGIISSEEVKQRLQLTATDLGSVGMDSQFGAGLVNVYEAVTR